MAVKALKRSPWDPSGGVISRILSSSRILQFPSPTSECSLHWLDVYNFTHTSMSFRVYPREPSPKALEANDLQSLAKYMKSDSCRNVFLMVISSLSSHVCIPWD
ncbi:hypothetical protein J3R82DRAFT_9574 [Butyriboletus roseoflavus]|nr:hypothetical protein J3R82DRAFT_9574 [Butyriboletus roseoflavus]